ncbi:NUDIX hydrolase [Mesobacillus maritimus]|nr:NUDIX hydrolase [Mesobacillus maritimus]
MLEYIKSLREMVGSQPLILVGATVIVLNERGELLLQLRSDTKEWGLPGGSMELGEILVETAARELFEETGLKAQRYTFIELLSGRDFYFRYPNGDEVYNVIAVFRAEDVCGEIEAKDRESLDLAYFPLTALPMDLDERAKIIIEKHCF